MILDLNTIKEICCGAVNIAEKDGYYEFDRFNAGQFENCRKCCDRFYIRSLSASGVRLAFLTDSEKLCFNYKTTPGASVTKGYFDVCVNGSIIDHFGGENDCEGRAEVSLGKGEKKVEVYFPWSKRTGISDLELDDGAFVTPVKRRLKLLAYGDSITQGYISDYPSLTYVSRLASMLDADVLNKGIGGDRFSDRIISRPDDVKPDVITVAYGSNDWNNQTREGTEKSARRFFSQLRTAYPDAKIFAVTPIWRADFDKETLFGCNADKVEDVIRENIKGIHDIIVVSGWNLVPHLTEFYADQYLHPNDQGFGIYAENLYKQMAKYI